MEVRTKKKLDIFPFNFFRFFLFPFSYKPSGRPICLYILIFYQNSQKFLMTINKVNQFSNHLTKINLFICLVLLFTEKLKSIYSSSKITHQPIFLDHIIPTTFKQTNQILLFYFLFNNGWSER